MDGLECSEVLYSHTEENKDFRIDSQFYTMAIKRSVELEYSPIGRHLISTQYGVSNNMNTDGYGYPIYRMNEIHHSLCDLTTEKYVELANEDFEVVKLNNRDVLFNRTNSFELVGRTGIYYDSEIPKTFASYLVRLVPDNIHIYSEYLAAFLNTRFGVQEIRRRARQSINQTNVNPEEVKAIEIPLLKREFQETIRICYEMAYQLCRNSAEKYTEAEDILAKKTNIDKTLILNNRTTIKTLSSSFATSGRLDAEYYQPKYDALFDALSKFRTQKLGGAHGLVTIKKSIEPGSEEYVEEGIPFVRVSDVSKFEISEPEIKLRREFLPNPEVLFPQKDTILLSKDGSVGLAYKVGDTIPVITSGALLHLNVRNREEILPDYLTLVLNSPIVQLQAERDSNGAIIQHWKPSEIENVIVPILDMNIQEIITVRVQESFALRKQSNELLEYAKLAVEMAIEQGEDVALEWLRDKIPMEV